MSGTGLHGSFSALPHRGSPSACQTHSARGTWTLGVSFHHRAPWCLGTAYLSPPTPTPRLLGSNPLLGILPVLFQSWIPAWASGHTLESYPWTDLESDPKVRSSFIPMSQTLLTTHTSLTCAWTWMQFAFWITGHLCWQFCRREVDGRCYLCPQCIAEALWLSFFPLML